MKFPKVISKGNFIKLFILLFSSLFSLFLFEKLLYIFSGEIKLGKPARLIRLKEHPSSESRIFKPDYNYLIKTDNLFIDEYKFRTDNEGFIEPSYIHEKSFADILFLGGSTTECRYVNELKRFPYLSGRFLEQDDKYKNAKINTINSGVSGNNSMHSINLLLNKSLKRKPKIAVLMHNINDLSSLLYMQSYWGENEYRSLLVEDKSKRLNFEAIPYSLGRLFPQISSRIRSLIPVKDEFKNIRGKQINYDSVKIINLFRKSLITFIELCKTWEIEPVLMTQMNRFDSSPNKMIIDWFEITRNDINISYKEYMILFKKFNNVIRETAKNENILLIDLALEIPQTKKYIYDVVHLTNEGSVLASQVIANELKSILEK